MMNKIIGKGGGGGGNNQNSGQSFDATVHLSSIVTLLKHFG
jgi:hypothetical protein